MYCKIQVVYCLLNLMDVLEECPFTPSARSVSCFSVWCCCTYPATLPGLSSLTQQLLMHLQGPDECLELPQFVHPTLTHLLKEGLAAFQGPCVRLVFYSSLDNKHVTKSSVEWWWFCLYTNRECWVLSPMRSKYLWMSLNLSQDTPWCSGPSSAPVLLCATQKRPCPIFVTPPAVSCPLLWCDGLLNS